MRRSKKKRLNKTKTMSTSYPYNYVITYPSTGITTTNYIMPVTYVTYNNVAQYSEPMFTSMTRDQLIGHLRTVTTKQTFGGKIVYALLDRAYRCGENGADILPDLVECIADGNYDEARHACELLSLTDTEIDEEDCKTFIKTLKEALIPKTRGANEDWRKDYINVCLEIFEAAIKEEKENDNKVS